MEHARHEGNRDAWSDWAPPHTVPSPEYTRKAVQRGDWTHLFTICLSFLGGVWRHKQGKINFSMWSRRLRTLKSSFSRAQDTGELTVGLERAKQVICRVFTALIWLNLICSENIMETWVCIEFVDINLSYPRMKSFGILSLESWWESRVSDKREMQQMQLMKDSWEEEDACATGTWFQIQ